MADMAHLDLDIPVRWTDLDAYGHVNNAAMVRLLEEARIAAFWPAPAEQVALGAQQPEAALPVGGVGAPVSRSEEHTSELQSRGHLVCRLLLEKTKEVVGDDVCVDNRNLIRRATEGTDGLA